MQGDEGRSGSPGDTGHAGIKVSTTANLAMLTLSNRILTLQEYVYTSLAIGCLTLH